MTTTDSEAVAAGSHGKQQSVQEALSKYVNWNLLKKYVVPYSAVVFVFIAAYYATFIAFLASLKNILYTGSVFGVWKAPEILKNPPSVLCDNKFAMHTHLQIEGIKLHCAQKGYTEKKPLLIFLHGTFDFWYSFRHHIDYYSKHYWVVALDLRGNGDSEKPAGFFSPIHYQLDNFADDIKNFINKVGREKATLIGHGFGGTIIYHLILKYPQIVDKYVTIAAPPPYATKFTPAQILKNWFEYFSFIPVLPELYIQQHNLYYFEAAYRKEDHEVVEAYKYTFSKPGALVFATNYLRANIVQLTIYYLKGPSVVEGKHLPSGLCLYGDKDQTNSVSAFKDVAKVPCLNGEKIEGGTFYLHQQKPEVVRSKIDSFLEVPAEALSEKSPLPLRKT